MTFAGFYLTLCVRMSLLWLAETSTIPRTMGTLGITWHATFSLVTWSFSPCPDQNSPRGPGNPVGFSELYLCAATFSVMLLFRCSVTQLCLTLCDPMDYSTPGFPVLHHLPELAQIHVHRVSDAIQLSHPLSSPSPPAFNLSQHWGLFQRVDSLHQVAKVLEFQLEHQSFK